MSGQSTTTEGLRCADRHCKKQMYTVVSVRASCHRRKQTYIVVSVRADRHRRKQMYSVVSV